MFCRYTAVDEKGQEYLFDAVRTGQTVSLTLKKEAFQKAKQLRILPELGRAQTGDAGFFLAPRNEGHDGDLLIRFLPREDVHYQYDIPIISGYCVKTPAVCALVRIERNYKYALSMDVKDGVYSICALFDFTQHDPIYDDLRVEIIYLSENATLGDFARTERELRLSRGEIVPLTEKCQREAVDYARKYPLIRIRMGWKPRPTPVLHQTPETEPEMHTVVTFARVRDIADSLKAHGVEGAELQLVGWNISGHDGRFPQLLPVDERLGGQAELEKTIAYVKSLGYRISLHTNCMDAYEIADIFDWDDLTIARDGNYVQKGEWSGGASFRICPTKQLELQKKTLPPVATMGLNGLHFSDVSSIVIPETCCSDKHPCYTTEGIARTQQIMEYIKVLFGGYSSEGCMDFSMKYVDYALYVSFAYQISGIDIPGLNCSLTQETVPFFELVYHGTLLYNPMSPTVNYAIKTPREKLYFWLRGGRLSYYFHSKFVSTANGNWMGTTDLIASDNASVDFAAQCIADSIRETQELTDLQCTYMKEYDVLENGIEVATYENGTRIVGNFSDTPASFEGHTLAPWGHLVLKEG